MTRFLILCLLILAGCSTPIECQDAACSKEDPLMPSTNNLSATGEITPGKGGAVLLQPGPLEPGQYTVQFRMADSNIWPTGNHLDIRAEITFSMGGNSVRRVVSVGDGVSISSPAESINVNVFDNSTIGVFPNVKPVNVSVMIGLGTRPAEERPVVLSLGTQGFAGGASANAALFVVPPDVGAISAHVSVAPAVAGTAISAYDILVHQVANASGTGQILNSYDPRQSDWEPLAPGTKSIVIETSAAAPQASVNVFLGIDG